MGNVQSGIDQPGTKRTEQPGVKPQAVAGLSREALWDIAARVPDPEIPVLSIADLGILRSAGPTGEAQARVQITPTYSACPAMDAIKQDLEAEFAEHGITVHVEFVLSPAWSSDWMTPQGRAKLERYGVAPPREGGVSGTALPRSGGPVPLTLGVPCPQCHSLHTQELSRYGSTACKALYQCLDCQEPFDYFKPY